MSQDEVRAATSEIVSGRVKVLYITPERFNNENFRKLLGDKDLHYIYIKLRSNAVSYLSV